jgi:hypothetical protein
MSASIPSHRSKNSRSFREENVSLQLGLAPVVRLRATVAAVLLVWSFEDPAAEAMPLWGWPFVGGGEFVEAAGDEGFGPSVASPALDLAPESSFMKQFYILIMETARRAVGTA